MFSAMPRRLVLIAAALACASAPAWTAEAQGGAFDAQLVKTGLYLISGGGSNTVLRLSGDGLIVVDAKAAGSYRALRKKIRRISDQPIRLLITTDDQSDRNGNDMQFRADGTRVVSTASVARNPAAASDTVVASGAPTGSEEIDQFGGIEVRILRTSAAHCGADTIVYFPDLKSVVVGDLYLDAADPAPASGGSLASWSRALAEILRLDFDVVLPSHGPAIARAQLLAFKTRIDRLTTSATPADAFDEWRLEPTGPLPLSGETTRTSRSR